MFTFLGPVPKLQTVQWKPSAQSMQGCSACAAICTVITAVAGKLHPSRCLVRLHLRVHGVAVPACTCCTNMVDRKLGALRAGCSTGRVTGARVASAMGEFSTVRASVSAEGLAKQRVCMADLVTPECAFSTAYRKSRKPLAVNSSSNSLPASLQCWPLRPCLSYSLRTVSPQHLAVEDLGAHAPLPCPTVCHLAAFHRPISTNKPTPHPDTPHPPLSSPQPLQAICSKPQS